MKSAVLIDAIVRHTTVLIARLSTAEGARSPLGHIANEVFAGISSELEAQGLRHKVIADMFGMALRSYRQKVQRLGESATTTGKTLWSAVLESLSEDKWTSRTEVLARFRFDNELSVRGILKDLVENGFVIATGKGETTRFRRATKKEMEDFGTSLDVESTESLAAVAWLQIYREGPLDLEALERLVPVPKDNLMEAIELLVSTGRVTKSDAEEGAPLLSTEQVLLPLGEEKGWEAAVVDHHRTVMNVLAAKLTGPKTTARSDEVGGSTFSFTLWPGHPMEAEIRGLLADTRGRLLPVWDRLVEYNESHPSHDDEYKVDYYCGQSIVEEETLE